ncbi:unnamed protein product, partial [Polarella glacialis]
PRQAVHGATAVFAGLSDQSEASSLAQASKANQALQQRRPSDKESFAADAVSDFNRIEEVNKIIMAREAQLTRGQRGRPEEKTDRVVDPTLQWGLTFVAFIASCLAAYSVVTTVSENNENREGSVSYADVCGTDAFQLKQMFFQSAVCVDMAMDIESAPAPAPAYDPQKELDKARGAKGFQKTAFEILAEMEAKTAAAEEKAALAEYKAAMELDKANAATASAGKLAPAT